MNSLIRIHRLRQIMPSRFVSTKSTGKGETGDNDKSKSKHNKLSQLQGLLSTMKISKSSSVLEKFARYGNSNLFNYVTNKKFKSDDLKREDLETWNKLVAMDTERACTSLPLNGFQEMILLTEQGKLWRYPIDNEQGLEKEKGIPFEEHVIFDHYLEKFPKNEYIQSFMETILSGLAKNHWMTVERKQSIIQFYIDYFEDRKEMYTERGFDI